MARYARTKNTATNVLFDLVQVKIFCEPLHRRKEALCFSLLHSYVNDARLRRLRIVFLLLLVEHKAHSNSRCHTRRQHDRTERCFRHIPCRPNVCGGTHYQAAKNHKPHFFSRKSPREKKSMWQWQRACTNGGICKCSTNSSKSCLPIIFALFFCMAPPTAGSNPSNRQHL